MKKIGHTGISSLSLTVLRCSIGIIYIWFGMLKFFPGYSPAEDLAIMTINKLTAGFIPAHTSIILLAIWETLAGILLIVNFQLRKVLAFMLLHMICTFTPLLLFPAVSFKIVALFNFGSNLNPTKKIVGAIFFI